MSWSTESFGSPSPAEDAQRQTLARAELLTRLAALFKTTHQLAPGLFASANPRPLAQSCSVDVVMALSSSRAILLLLYGAGLRVGEAVALTLTLADVDLPGAVITVRNTKFHKTRIVPLGFQLNQVIAQYATCREAAGHSREGSAPFFVLRRGAGVSVSILVSKFRIQGR